MFASFVQRQTLLLRHRFLLGRESYIIMFMPTSTMKTSAPETQPEIILTSRYLLYSLRVASRDYLGRASVLSRPSLEITHPYEVSIPSSMNDVYEVSTHVNRITEHGTLTQIRLAPP